MFYLIGAELFHTVLKEGNGEWVISFDHPSSPQFLSLESLSGYEKREAPAEYVKNLEKNDMTEIQKNKKKLIEPLLFDTECIKNRKKRNEIAKKQAERNGINKKTVLNLYYLYLSKGTLYRKITRNREAEKYDDVFTKAIRKYYFSARRMSLKTAYDLMLLEWYTDENGNLKEEIPSWYCFRHFYYNNHYHLSSQKEISRNGLSSYKRNSRPLFGSTNRWKDSIGYYQLDATTADIYLVSKLDPKIVVGRPYIYMAVDTATELITGIYVGFESDESAVISCIVNSAEDKVPFCKRYQIEIQSNQWPSVGLPGGIITDQGREFIGERTRELCMKYGMEIEALPPFRPDEKSLVEKTFDILQNIYRPLLFGKGIIEADSQERWATDYREQAVLNLDEFTRIILRCVIYLNSFRLLPAHILTKEMLNAHVSPIAAELWRWYLLNHKESLIPTAPGSLKKLGLKRTVSKISRKGISHKGFYYQSQKAGALQKQIGTAKNVTIAYDDNDISFIYAIVNEEYIRFDLKEQYHSFLEVGEKESLIVKRAIAERKKEDDRKAQKARVQLLSEIKNVVESVKPEKKEKLEKEKISKDRKTERGIWYE